MKLETMGMPGSKVFTESHQYFTIQQKLSNYNNVNN